MAEAESFEAMVERAFFGNGTEFNKLYGLIYHSARKITEDHHAAQDVAGEVLKKMWKEWQERKVRDRFKLKSWILRVTHNEAVDYLRKVHLATPLDDVEDTDESPLRDFLATACPTEIPEEYVERQEFRGLIWRVLSDLSEVKRSCLILRFMEKVSLKEIAELYGCSERQIQRYIREGKNEFLQVYLRLVAEQHMMERSSGR